MIEGFIQLHRKLIEWEWYDDLPTFKLFIHLLLKANYKTKIWRGETIERGQLKTSISHLAHETGLSEKQIRTALNKLIKTGEVGKATTSHSTVITVLSYNSYQDKGKPLDTPRANEGQTKGKRRATTNKDNKVNNENKVNNLLLGKEAKETKFDFKKNLIDFGFQQDLVDEWILIRRNKKAINTERALKMFISEIEKTGKPPNEVLEIIVKKQWKGFEAIYLNNLQHGPTATNNQGIINRSSKDVSTDFSKPNGGF